MSHGNVFNPAVHYIQPNDFDLQCKDLLQKADYLDPGPISSPGTPESGPPTIYSAAYI